MARIHRTRPLSIRPRLTPYNGKECILSRKRKASLATEKRDWKGAKCSVCMEFPHNAVLLLCSSHDKGCRPYMCGTSYRHSNCLDQFKKAYTKANELAACPLCRGQVKAWTVVEPAREYLDNKRRSCMQDDCSFKGTYKELRKHVKSTHPCARPREVDPTVEQNWRQLEHEREQQDVISTIRSSMPRSVVFGDYVVDMEDSSDLDESEVDHLRGNHDVGNSILYFFLREGARFMRQHNDDDAGEHYNFPSMSEIQDGNGIGSLRSEGRRRRRRRGQGNSS